MRLFRSRVLFVVAIATLIAGGSLVGPGVGAAGAKPSIVVHCPTDDLQTAINSAAPGSTIVVAGTCVGNFSIGKNLTLVGPATLDGGTGSQFGATLHVSAGTVELNDLTIQHGTGILNFGGGLWNGGQLTLNRSTVTDNHAQEIGGVFNYGKLTLNRSTVSQNTATQNVGGIFNCGASYHEFGLCTGAPGSLTLNNSTVTGNSAQGAGAGLVNDEQASATLNSSIVSGNVASGGGGGIVNNGGMTINGTTVSGNAAFGGGAISNGARFDASPVPAATLTINNSTLQGNTANLLGGAISTSGPLTINKSNVSNNSAGPCPGDCFGFGGAGLGGAIFIFSQATTVANSTFSNNTTTSGADSPAGILVQPPSAGGSGTFSATHSTFS